MNENTPRIAMGPSRLIGFLVCFALALGLTAWLPQQVVMGQSAGDSSKPTIVDKTKVYFGKPSTFRKAAVIKFAKVTPHIPEYVRIKDKRLKPSDAEYQVLCQAGTKRFRKVVKQVAKKKGYDLVVETTAIVAPAGVVLTDLTNDVIKKLGGTP